MKQGRAVLDLDGEIQEEYRRHLSPGGQPGVGDRFFQVIMSSAPSRVERVQLTGFDRADRKFAAAARKAAVPVANAVDHDWLEHAAALAAANISVQFVCGCDPVNWFE